MEMRLTFRAALPLALVLASLQACTKPHQAAPPAPEATEPRTDSQAIEELRTGAAALTCGSECEADWTSNRPKLKALYDAQDWRALAAAVTKIGFQQDLGYYYLGRAAEALRFYDASLSYYRTAVHLSTEGDLAVRCRGKSDRCDGFLLPADVLPRISIATTEQARAKSFAAARRYGSASRPAASSRTGAEEGPPKSGEPQSGDAQAGAPLIDPPPVAR